MISIKFKNNFSKVLKNIANEKDRLMSSELAKIKDDLVINTPVDTGAARAGWEVENKTIRNSVPYLKQLNEGTSQQAPARFIEHTVLKNPNVRVTGIVVNDK